MEFKPFDTSKIDELRDQYAEEAKARWGNTEAYRESARRTAKYTDEEFARIQERSAEVTRGFAALIGTDPKTAASSARQGVAGADYRKLLCLHG